MGNKFRRNTWHHPWQEDTVFKYFYASAGLGLLASLDGVGGGLYTSVGLDTSAESKRFFGFVAEYKQSLGFNSYGQIMSYALRFGISVNF